MNHKIILSYFLVVGFFICLVFAYMQYSNSIVETENDKLRQNIISTLDKEVLNLQSQIDILKNQPTAVTDVSEQNLNQLVESYIKNNPATIATVLENFYKQKTLEEQHKAIDIGINAIIDDLSNGNLKTFTGKIDAPIKIVDFFDYSCGFCIKMLEVNKKIMNENKDVMMVFVELPMLGAESVEAMRFAIAISMFDQSKYLDFQMQLLSANIVKNSENLMQIAGNVGVDVLKLQQFMSDRENMNKIETRIKQNSIIANNMHLQGTPTYIIDDEVLVGAASYDSINQAIIKARDSRKDASVIIDAAKKE